MRLTFSKELTRSGLPGLKMTRQGMQAAAGVRCRQIYVGCYAI